jgi:subtilisin-like proprotein convertase family protein
MTNNGKESEAMIRDGYKCTERLIGKVGATLAITLLVAGTAPDLMMTAEARPNPKLVQTLQNSNQLGIGGGDDAPAESTTIDVSGFTAPVADVDVSLLGITFGPASSQDMDIVLIGPGGQTALILSDVGGNTATSNVTLTLDDQAANHLPNNTALTNGTFQPTNFGTGDTFHLGGGGGNFTPPSGSALGIFNGSDPNGTWELLAIDDEGNGNTGSIIQGWRLKITSANGVPSAQADTFQAQAGQQLSVRPAGVLANDSDPDGDTLTAVLAGEAKKGKVDLQSDGSFTYRPNKNAKGSDSFTYIAQDPGGLFSLNTASMQIKGKKHKKGKR